MTRAIDRRLLAAFEGALSVSAEVTPEAVLQRTIDVAREVVGARYGALGLADPSGRLVKFLLSGVTPDLAEAIGNLPEGHGLLGEVIRHAQPIIVEDIKSDPRSFGLPQNHPEMTRFVGVPIVYGMNVLGNLYLTDRLDGQPFDDGDLAALQVLATHCATAIDRAELYRQLREQRDRLRTMLDNLPSGVIILGSPNAALQFANAAFVRLALGPSAPPGVLPMPERDYALMRADGLPLDQVDRPEVRVFEGEIVQHQQLTLRRSDGSSVPVSVQAAPLRDADAGIAEAVLVFQDVTQLRQAEQVKDDFLSLISHEFRTPLTSIHGGAHLLADAGDSLDTRTRNELLGDIVSESDRLDRMLKNLLSLAAIMAGRLTPDTEPVLLAPLLRTVAAEVRARNPGFGFVVDIPPGLPPVEGDPSLIAQVVRNLYENAVKYSPGGGRVRSTGRVDGPWVIIDIADEGQGISAAHLGQVFERFHRAGADPTVRGMGLGMYLSRLLVEAQHGSITVSSPGPGQGSTFSIALPLSREWEDDEDTPE